MSNLKIFKYLVRYKQNSLFITNFITVLLIVFVIVSCITLSCYYFYSDLVTDAVEKTNNESLERSCSMIDMFMSDCDGVLINMCNNSDIKQFMSKTIPEKWDYERVEKIKQLRSVLSSMIASNDYIVSVDMYSAKNDLLISSSNDYNITEAHKEFIEEFMEQNVNDANGIDSYDETDDRYAPVMIIRQYYNEFNNFNGQEPYEVMAVASKSMVLDDNKESCVALKGYVGANEKTVLALEDNLFNNVGIGDIVTLIPNKDGKAYHKVVLYDFVEGTSKTDASRYKVKSNMGNQFGCYSGKVVDIANSGTTLFVTTNPSDDTKANSTMCNIASPAVYICNEKEQTLTPASVGDISIEDTIAIYYNSYSAKTVVIYRED